MPLELATVVALIHTEDEEAEDVGLAGDAESKHSGRGRHDGPHPASKRKT